MINYELHLRFFWVKQLCNHKWEHDFTLIGIYRLLFHVRKSAAICEIYMRYLRVLLLIIKIRQVLLCVKNNIAFRKRLVNIACPCANVLSIKHIVKNKSSFIWSRWSLSIILRCNHLKAMVSACKFRNSLLNFALKLTRSKFILITILFLLWRTKHVTKTFWGNEILLSKGRH